MSSSLPRIFFDSFLTIGRCGRVNSFEVSVVTDFEGNGRTFFSLKRTFGTALARKIVELEVGLSERKPPDPLTSGLTDL